VRFACRAYDYAKPTPLRFASGAIACVGWLVACAGRLRVSVAGFARVRGYATAGRLA